MLTVVGAIGLSAAAWFASAGALRALAVLLAAMWCGYGLVAHPVLDPSSSARALMRHARELAGPGTAIGLVQWKEQNLLQALGPTAEFGFRQPAPEQLRRGVAWLDAAPARRRLLLTQPRAQPTCFAEVPGAVQRVGTANRRDYYLVKRAAILPRCFGATLSDQSP
jgi:hypothetical protein